TLLYAMGAGTPVIGTDVGGTGESVPDDGVRGLIVPAGDASALGEAIGRFLSVTRTDLPPGTPRLWRDVADDYAGVLSGLRRGRPAAPTAWPGLEPLPYSGPSETVGVKQ
ncbi:MAG: glycosyltransferase, partial [Thermoplasmata archaeon]